MTYPQVVTPKFFPSALSPQTLQKSWVVDWVVPLLAADELLEFITMVDTVELVAAELLFNIVFGMFS